MQADLQALVDHYKVRRNFNAQQYLEDKVAALNNFFRTQGIDSVVMGLSGGIDSAVVLYLLHAASQVEDSPLDHIVALSLPIHKAKGVSGQQAAADKAHLAYKRLPNPNIVTYRERDLSAAYAAIVDTCDHPLSQVAWAEGQMASVLRTPIFYYYAAQEQTAGYRSLVVGTTNRDEGAYLGFFGKASDAMVDMQPIGDLHKSEVYKLAALLGVPTYLIEDTPRGDVWDERVDEQMIGAPYWMVELYQQMLSDGYDYVETDIFGDPERYTGMLSEESELLFKQYAGAIEALHKTNSHKYAVGNPAHFVDVLERAVPGGWRA